MKLEKKKGYPQFRESIINFMVNDLNIDKQQAINIVNSPAIVKKINSDILFAEHQGIEWWAYELTDRFIHTVSPYRLS
jgi:hypothetical protein